VLAGSPPTEAEQSRFPHHQLPSRGVPHRLPPSEHLQPRHHFKKDRLSPWLDHIYTFTVNELRSKPKPPSSFSGRRVPPVDGPHQPSSVLANLSNCFVRAPHYSSISSPSTLTSPPVQRHRFPASREPPPWRRYCGEPPSTLLPPTGSPWSSLPPWHHLIR
jgi:hypothetical protein